MLWAWEWSGSDPVENNVSYTFIFMNDGTGSYTVYRSGRQVGSTMSFKWNAYTITIELSNGNQKQYLWDMVDVNNDDYVAAARVIISDWNDNGKTLILQSDFKGN